MSKRKSCNKENEAPLKKIAKTNVQTKQPSQTSSSGVSDETEPIALIAELLANKKASGNFSIGGKATEMPSLPGLKIKGLGLLTTPLCYQQANELIKICSQAPYGLNSQTLVDTSVRDSYELNSSFIEFTNPKWNEQLKVLTDRVANELGCANKKVEAKLYKLLLYKTGGHFKKHRDTEKEKRMFGTLVIQLPSVYSGGNLVVYNNRDSSKRAFDFGQKSGEAPFTIQYAAHYADLEHELLQVTSGYRLVLTYSLCWSKDTKCPIKEAMGHTLMCNALGDLEDSYEDVAILLDHRYTESSLLYHGVNALKGLDRDRFDMLKNANNKLPENRQYGFFIVKATLEKERGKALINFV